MMNQQLLCAVTEVEVCNALNQMAPLKSPGPTNSLQLSIKTIGAWWAKR